MALIKIKEIYLSYSGNKIVSSKDIVNFTEYLFESYRKAGKKDENDLLYCF